MATITTTAIISNQDYTFNSTYDENCVIDGYLCCNNQTNLGTSLIQNDLTLTGTGDNFLYCNNKANFYKQVYLFDNEAATNYGEGALVVVGGCGVGGNIRAGYNISCGLNLDVSQNLNVVGNTSITGTLTVENNITHNGYFLSPLYITDSTNPTNYGDGALTVVGGVGIGGTVFTNGNINTTKNINTSITTTPASVNSLGYQITTTNSLNGTITNSVYYNCNSFTVNSTNFGTYLLVFNVNVGASATGNLLHQITINTTTNPANVGANGSSLYLPGGLGNQILVYSRVFSLYTAQTLYGLIKVTTSTGTVTLFNSTLQVTRIA